MSNRQRRILEVLLGRQGEVTAGQLAEEVRISSRTVHRELQELEIMLQQHGLSLVKKSGFGIILEGDEPNLNRFQEALRRSETETYSPLERKLLILCMLLEENEPIKLFSIAREVQAAIPTVSRDLEELELQFVHGDLKLIRKRGYGVEIVGLETAKRQLIVRLAEDYLDHSDFFTVGSGQSEVWPTTRRLQQLAGKDSFLAIEQSLWNEREEWLKDLQEAEYTRLLIRLSVAIIRIQNGHLIGPYESGKPAAGIGLHSDRLNDLIRRLDLDVLPAEEAEYLQMLFHEAKERSVASASVMLDKFGMETAEKAVQFIRLLEIPTGIPLSRDRSLLDGLIRHLGPAIERIRKGDTIRNPLLSQIKRDYEFLFHIVRKNADDTWPQLAVPDEEIGYLVMHFGAAMERWMLMPGNVRVLLVCTSGIGSSKLLAVRITKEIPQIHLLGHYSWYEASRMPQESYDLIVSTVDLPVEADRYIKLSPLLTREETEKLRAYVRKLALTVTPPVPAAPVKEIEAWERLQLMSGYSSELIALLKKFQVYASGHGEADVPQNLQALLENLLNMLSLDSILLNKETIAKQLVDRENQGSLLIPDSNLALLHTRSEWITEPVIALFNLQSPIRLGADAHETRQIFLMLAPAILNKEALEVLSEISAMLLLPKMIEWLEVGNTEQIRAYISGNMENYIKTKLEWREPS